MTNNFSQLVIFALAIHLFVDWYLQNDWQARNKSRWLTYWYPKGSWGFSYPHPAGILHAGLHGVAMLLVFPPCAASFVMVTHFLIDLRTPLIWWRKTFRQTTDPSNPAALHVAMWQDQIAHWLILGAVAWFVS